MTSLCFFCDSTGLMSSDEQCFCVDKECPCQPCKRKREGIPHPVKNWAVQKYD